MAELKKRERGSNFSADEINTLVSIVSEHKGVIECKKTDATTWRQKDRTCDTITESFNSCLAVPRTKKTLRTKYEDIKKNVRKKYAHNKMEQFKTGGGASVLQKLSNMEENVAAIMGLTIDGGPSIWDSDRIPEMHNQNTAVEDDIMDKVNYESQTRQIDDETPFEDLETLEYLEDAHHHEEAAQRTTTNVVKELPPKGVPLLKRPMTLEVRPVKKAKRVGQVILPSCACDTDRKDELHQMRMSILQKELEINEARLEAANLEVEIKKIQKQHEEVRLGNILA